MTLAYLFWHQSQPGVAASAYELALLRFHAMLDVHSAAFRVDPLPFDAPDGGAGYEDWYLIDDWAQLGALNQLAVDVRHRIAHDAAAGLMSRGWGSVYALLRGVAEPPRQLRWTERPAGRPSAALLRDVGGVTVWQRQLALGPAPELCIGEPGGGWRELLEGHGDGVAESL